MELKYTKMQSNMEHIKITDLSIGDWVIYNEKYYQILNIGTMTYEAGVGLLFRHYCTLTRGMDIQDDIDINEISPIPITPEILEKNGIPHIINDVWAYDEDYQLSWFKNGRTILINYSNKHTVSFFAKYIHQLQHALRLVGIDKEITL